jgi:bifunctional DNA-binding transcriptional regulator/antitoxin component of YhaV-PrlF toxin-antitoxin module
MKFESKMTSKGTITIAAPLRKALGLKPGQTVRLEWDKKNNRVSIETGMSFDELERLRDQIVNEIPRNRKALSIKQMRDMAAKKWLAERSGRQK